MDGIQFALPRPGPAVKALLIALGVCAVVEGFLANWVSHGGALIGAVTLVPEDVLHRPWTLVTTFFVTDPHSYSHVLFSLIGLYFLGSALEPHWGAPRFLRFVALVSTLSYALAAGIALVSPKGNALLSPPYMIGPDAALTALALAFGREFPTRVIRLFFVIPVSGKVIVWITVGFALLGLVLASSTYEGTTTRIAAVGFAFLLAGTPSPARAIYLRMKLWFLRRRGGGAAPRGPAPVARKRGTASLRVVRGGLDDEDRPPKDQLN